ncbi:MAG TPA: hypothetical protein VNU84_04550 [Candidatus Acidoferrum sp.]|nr:hypothetical protein [Candidatus Acidoferrum sp.]
MRSRSFHGFAMNFRRVIICALQNAAESYHGDFCAIHSRAKSGARWGDFSASMYFAVDRANQSEAPELVEGSLHY